MILMDNSNPTVQGVDLQVIDFPRNFSEASAQRSKNCPKISMVCRQLLHAGPIAQFIACRRLNMVAMGMRRAYRGSRLCRRCILQRRGDTPRLRQILRATKCEQLSDPVSACNTRVLRKIEDYHSGTFR